MNSQNGPDSSLLHCLLNLKYLVTSIKFLKIMKTKIEVSAIMTKFFFFLNQADSENLFIPFPSSFKIRNMQMTKSLLRYYHL